MASEPPVCKCEKPLQDPVDKGKNGRWLVNCTTCRAKARAKQRQKNAEYGVCFGQKKAKKYHYINQNDDPPLQPDALEENVNDVEDALQVCDGCGDPFRARDVPHLASCQHKPAYCEGCFIDGLSVMINGADPENIQCLSKCPTRITYEDIRTLAPPNLFERYDNILACRATNADPNFQRCLGPGCNSGQVHDSTIGPIFTCVHCRYRMCTAHDPPVPLHEGQSCAEYTFHNDKNQQNEAAQAEVARMSVACPECGAMIHKYDGCDHMTCRYPKCGMEFCYVCRARYAGKDGIRQRGNAAHGENCRYHTSRLR